MLQYIPQSQLSYPGPSLSGVSHRAHTAYSLTCPHQSLKSHATLSCPSPHEQHDTLASLNQEVPVIKIKCLPKDVVIANEEKEWALSDMLNCYVMFVVETRLAGGPCNNQCQTCGQNITREVVSAWDRVQWLQNNQSKCLHEPILWFCIARERSTCKTSTTPSD